jgi:chromosome segregation ATPase
MGARALGEKKMVSGSTVYKKIQEQIRTLEGNESKTSSQIEGCEKKIDSLTGERETAYVSLAEAYLPELTSQSVKQTLREVQSDVQRIFQRKQDRRKELESFMASALDKKQTADDKLENITEQLNQKVTERQKLSKDVGAELSADSRYTGLVSQADQTKERLSKNNERLKSFKEEAEEKLPAYDANKFFSYLLNRKFGTEEYHKKGLIKNLDSWVSKKVDYAVSKRNYDFLKTMPELMEIEIKNRQEAFEDLVSKIRKKEKEVADNYGLTTVIEEGTALLKKRDDLIGLIAKINEEYKNYSSERKESDSTKDSYHQEAIQKLKAFLKGDDISDLKQKAKSTPGSEDDQLVARLEEIDGDVRGFKDKSKGLKKERDALQEKLSALSDMERKYRSNDYESSRSQFPSGFDIDALIIGYILGRNSIDSVWDTIKNKQDFEEDHSYSYSSSSSDDHHSSGSFGSGFGGGSHSSGGGFGGGFHSSGSGF